MGTSHFIFEKSRGLDVLIALLPRVIARRIYALKILRACGLITGSLWRAWFAPGRPISAGPTFQLEEQTLEIIDLRGSTLVR